MADPDGQDRRAGLRWGIALLALVGLPSIAGAAVTVQSVTTGSARVTGNGSVSTAAFTPAGSNRLLVVGVSMNDRNDSNATVGGVAFGGQAFPAGNPLAVRQETRNDRARVELWYWLNPPQVNGVVTVTLAGNSNTIPVVVGAICFSDVDQTTPFGTLGSAVGTGDPGSSVTVPTTAGDLVLDVLAIPGNRVVGTSPGQTPRWGLPEVGWTSPGSSSSDVYGFGSTELATGANVTMSEIFEDVTGDTQDSDWAQIAVPIRPSPSADVSITKVDSPDPAAVGQNVTYTLTVANAGPQSASNVVVTDDLLPSGMTYVSATPSQGTCSGTSTVTCSLGAIANGASASIQIVVTPTSTGVKTNTASVTATQPDPNLANNQDSASTTVVPPSADLSMVKDAPSPVYLGDTFSFTLTVSNGGPSLATNVTTTDALPASLAFRSAVPSQGSCSGTTTITCSLGSIASGSSAIVTINVQALALGAISNTAAATATEPDPSTANNSSTVSVTVLQVNIADVAITKTGSPASVAIGANVTYTLTVVNGGPDTAQGVTVTDPIPPGLTLVSVTPTLGTCSGTLTLNCDLGDMTNAATATITIVATVTTAGTKSNTATVGIDTSTTYDPDPVNNSATATTAVGGAAPLCSVPGSIGPGGTLSGVINTYYPGTASVAAGATSLTLGAARGASAPIAIGDLLLVIQMQDAQINITNTDCYGAGVGCQGLINGTGPGAGAIAGTVNAGKYEFVRATNAVALGGGTLNVLGAGAGNGLVNGYTDASATAAKGQARFQVVRGLEFTSATLDSATPVTAVAWTTDANGRGTGGVLALDVQGTLTMGSGLIASVDGLGFRGAAGRQLTGETGTCNLNAGTTITPNGQDWRSPTGTGFADPCDTHGGKGEGNAGTPRWVYNPNGAHTCGSGTNTFVVDTGQPNDGYPNGSMARGAPGNAGGGSTDPNPPSNDQNSGGGGGSNGGAGGTGGRSWFSNLDRGGRGAAVTPSFSQLVLGGGGGAGTRNNDNCGNNGATAADEGQASSGAAGGGLMVLRAASFAITAGSTVTANGADAYDESKNDGGGGGGAGGSAVLTVTSGTMGGLNVQATGGSGGSAWKTEDGTTNPGNRHGPGGGGGGGVVAYTSTAALPSVVVDGGLPGTSTTAQDNFGAQPGALGQTLFVAPGQIPGVGSASDCTPDPAITLTHTPATAPQGGTVTFFANVSNAGPFISTSGALSVSITIDAGMTPTTVSGTGWTCSIAGQTVTCGRSDPLAAHQSFPPISIGATVVAVGPTLLSNNVATVGGGGDINTANNTATDAVGVAAPTLARLRSFQAVRFADAVQLHWQTSFESNNLGFRVYREVGGVRQPLTPSLIAGSTLFVGRREMTSGRSYAWADRDAPVGSDPLYWLEDIDVDGTRQWTGPVSPQAPTVLRRNGSLPNSPLLKGLGRPLAGRAAAALPQGLGIERRAQPRPAGNRLTPAPLWSPPSRPAAKILVQREGWYRVTKAELFAAGYDPGMDPRTLRLLADGTEEAILVRDGGDGSFDSADSIEFYGVGLDSPYDDVHVYWLLADKDGGARIESLPWGSFPEAPVSFPFTVERKDRTVFFSALTTNGDAENFFGPVITSDPVTQELLLAHPDLTPAGESPLRVALQGVTAGVAHDVEVQVNGHSIDAIAFFGQEHPVEVLSVPNAWLHEGSNLVTLMARAGEDDVSLVDSVQLTYPHLYRLDADALRMTAPAHSTLTIPRLGDDSLRAIDLSHPGQPRELPVRWTREGPWFTASVGVFGPDPATVFAFSSARVLSPSGIVANVPSRLRSRQNGADLVILAHPSLVASAKPLHDLRQAQGLATQLIDVTDVYDEFAFGHKSPYAIRDFLLYADQAWGQRPRYVLLVGDASFDPKDYLAMGSFDLLPTKFIPTASMKTDSDDWFVDFDGDSLPELAIGRLPARNAAEASIMISKIVARDSAAPANQEPWNNSVLLIADRNDGYDFEAATQALRQLLPPKIEVQQVLVGQVGGAAHDQIVSLINAGQLLVNYTGHGSEDVWSRLGVFGGPDATALTNGARLPVVVGMTCLNGLFDDVYVESLAEAFLKAPNGGAVAVWASSALTDPDPQARLNQELFRLLFQGRSMTLGEAIVRAKAAVPESDVRRTWILFGDPTMRLR